MLRTIFAACLLLSTSALFAQGAVTGTITDAQTLPLPGANIWLSELNAGTVSRNNGEFILSNLPEGSYTMVISYIGYTDFTSTVSVTNNQTTVLNAVLQQAELLGTEVIIMGDRLVGQAKALNQQKNNDNITNIIASDQIGRFPDANVGDALKRVPGITVAYDQGEPRFGLIRGTEARLNTVMLNGERIPSAEGDVRNVQLDLIPADMMAGIEVHKAVTPDMDADAIGGAVNLITRTATETRLSGTLGSGYNQEAGKPVYTGALVAGKRFAADKLGIIFSGSYNLHNMGSDNFEAEWEKEDDTYYMTSFESREYDIQRIRRSLSLTTDYKLAPGHKIMLTTMYNNRDDFENRYGVTYKLDDSPTEGIPDEAGMVEDITIEREVKAGGPDSDGARWENQQTLALTLEGQHLFAQKIKLNWNGSYMTASEEKQKERYIIYAAEEVDVMTDVADPYQPIISLVDPSQTELSSFELDEITQSNDFTEERDLKARFDLEIPVGNPQNKFQVGAKIRYKEKLRNNNFQEYSPLNGDYDDMSLIGAVDLTEENFLAGPYETGFMPDGAFIGNLDLDNTELFESEDVPEEYQGSNYDATESIFAAYAQYKHLWKNWMVLAGVRMENTAVEYLGYEFVEDDATFSETTGSDSYLNILPGLHLRYRLKENTNFRFAWTNTLARPNYFDLVPYRYIVFEDNVLEEGNPELAPTTSMNIDFMYETFFSSIGVISAGAFYKDINDFIFNYTINDYVDPVSGNTFDEYVQPRNGGAATLYGVELALQRQLDFLPGIWKGLGVYVNYTLTESTIDGLPVEGREEEKLALPGTARHSFNGSLSYENKKVVIRLSANANSAFIEAGEIGEEAFYDRWNDKVFYLDANASYAFTPSIRGFAEAINITNQPLRFYQGTEPYTGQVEYYGARFNLGVKFDIF